MSCMYLYMAVEQKHRITGPISVCGGGRDAPIRRQRRSGVVSVALARAEMVAGSRKLDGMGWEAEGRNS